MKRRTASVLIGAFVLGALAVAILFVVFLARSDFWVKKSVFVLNFDHSVSGLKEGAPVQFRGVRIGRVSDIRVVTNPQTMNVNMPVFIEIDPRRILWKDGQGEVEQLFSHLIDRGLRARIRVLSYITGQRMIELDVLPGTPRQMSRRELEHPEIPTVPSRLQELSRTLQELPLQELLTKLTSAVEGVERIVSSREVTRSLYDLSQTLRSARSLFATLGEHVPGMSRQLNATLGEAQGVILRADSQLKQLAEDLRKASRAAEDAFRQMEGTFSLEQGVSGELATSMRKALQAARSTLEQTEASLSAVEDMAGDSELRFELASTLKEISSAARSIRSLAQYLERHPDALWRGKGSP